MVMKATLQDRQRYNEAIKQGWIWQGDNTEHFELAGPDAPYWNQYFKTHEMINPDAGPGVAAGYETSPEIQAEVKRELAASRPAEQVRQERKARAVEIERKREVARESAKEARSTAQAPFENVNTQLPDGKWIANKDLLELKQESPEAYHIATTKGLDAANNFIMQSNKAYTKAAADFKRNNSLLPDGKYVANTELARIKTESPEIYNILTTKGFDAAGKYIDDYNAEIEKHNASVKETNAILKGDIKGKSKTEIIKSIWRALTPWDESGGESFIDYAKGYPGRVIQTANKTFIAPPQQNQEELKRLYNEQQQQKKEMKSTPLWAKILFPVEDSIVYDKKKDRYLIVVAGEAPLVGGAKKEVVKTASKVAAKVATSGAKEAGMSESLFRQFVKARVANPKLSPDEFKAGNIIKDAPKTDWPKFFKEITKGKITNAKQAEQFAKKNPTPGYGLANKPGGVHSVTPEVSPTLKATVLKTVKEADRQTKTGLPSKIQNLLTKLKPQATPDYIKPKNIGSTTLATVGLQSKTISSKQRELSNIQQQINKLQEQSREAVSPRTEQATQTKLQHLTRQITNLQNEIQTEVQDQAAIQTQAATILSNAVQQLSETATATQNKTLLKNAIDEQLELISDTATRTNVEQQIDQIIKPVIKPTTSITPSTPTKPIDPTKPKPPKRITPIKPPSIDATDKEKREYIKNAKGAIAWNQFPGKDEKLWRWYVITYPYESEKDFRQISGRMPEGARPVAGPYGARMVAQRLYGKAPTKKLMIDMGVQDVIIAPKGRNNVSINFRPDPDEETTGDITIGRGKTRIFPLAKGGSYEDEYI